MPSPNVYRTPFLDIAVGTGVYTANDALGVKTTVNVPKHGVIMGFTLVDRDSEEDATDIILFKSDFTGTADHDPFSVTDADLDNLIGHLTIVAADYATFATNSIATIENISLPYYCPTGTLSFQCVTRGTPTYTAVTDVKVSFLIVL